MKQEKQVGTIIRLKPGYGFLVTTTGVDKFFSYADVVGDGFALLTEGMNVTWVPGVGRNGKSCATDIEVIEQ